MIISALMKLIYTVISLLTSFISIPSLPDGVSAAMDTALEYIGLGLGILSNYTHLDYLLVLFGIIIAIDLGLAIYHLVMFILKKIPFLGIE